MKKIFLCSVIVAIVVIIIAISFLGNFNKEKNYDGNLMNMGLAIKDGEEVFYNKYPNGIYKIKSNNEEELLVEDLAYSMNIKDDWIFYLTLGDSYKLDLVKIKKDGTSRQIISNINSTYTRIYVKDNWIYYSNYDGGKNIISKVDINGENKKIVLDSAIQNFQVTDEYIYYTDMNNSIRRMKIENGENKLITPEGTAKNFQVAGKYAYYVGIKSNRLEKVNLNNLKIQMVTENIKSEPFNVVDDIIYYYDSNNKKICSYNIKNSENVEIIEIEGGNTFINIAGDDLYFLDNLKMNRININGGNTEKISYEE